MRPSNKYVCKELFFFVFVFKNKHDSLKVVKNIGSERAILEHFWPAWQTDAKNVLTSHLTCELWSMILLLNQSTDTSINLIYMYITYDYYDPLARMIIMIHLHTQVFGGGRVVRRCRVSYVTGASNWYWLTVGQGLLSLQQVRVEGECFYFFCFFTFIPVPLSSLFLSFISSPISSITLLPFCGRRHKMTHKGWRVIKPKYNQHTSIHET